MLIEMNGDLKIPRMVLFFTKECSAREKQKKKKKRHTVYHICLKRETRQKPAFKAIVEGQRCRTAGPFPPLSFRPVGRLF